MTPDNWMWIRDQLLKQKARFKNFLLMSESMIEHFQPQRMQAQRPETCSTARIPSFRADGEKISKCILSSKADCGACGCVITGMVDGIHGGNLRTIQTVNRMITT
jgi:hypothetical protein